MPRTADSTSRPRFVTAQATLAQTGEAEIAASYAHALARCGKVGMAKRVLKRAIRHGATSDQAALQRWLDAGAPTQVEQESAGPSGPGAASARRKPKRRRPREQRSLGD